MYFHKQRNIRVFREICTDCYGDYLYFLNLHFTQLLWRNEHYLLHTSKESLTTFVAKRVKTNAVHGKEIELTD